MTFIKTREILSHECFVREKGLAKIKGMTPLDMVMNEILEGTMKKTLVKEI